MMRWLHKHSLRPERHSPVVRFHADCPSGTIEVFDLKCCNVKGDRVLIPVIEWSFLGATTTTTMAERCRALCEVDGASVLRGLLFLLLHFLWWKGRGVLSLVNTSVIRSKRRHLRKTVWPSGGLTYPSVRKKNGRHFHIFFSSLSAFETQLVPSVIALVVFICPVWF